MSTRLPTTVNLVNEALITLHHSKGITLNRVYSYITETYETAISGRRKLLVKKYLTSLRQNEDICNVTGRGLNGHFKLVNKQKYVRRLNSSHTSTRRRQNDLSHTDTMTVRDGASVELPVATTLIVTSGRNLASASAGASRRVRGKSKRAVETLALPPAYINRNVQPMYPPQVNMKSTYLASPNIEIPQSQDYPLLESQEPDCSTPVTAMHQTYYAENQSLDESESESNTPTQSPSVHTSTPIPSCASILLAPQRHRKDSHTAHETISLQSIVERTPRSSLTKRRRRINL